MMKRTKIFVLLCAFVLALCTGAWAAEDAEFIKVPIVSDPQNGDDVPITIDDYTVELVNDENDGTTAAKAKTLKITATDLPAHYNGNHAWGYWMGLGITMSDATKGYYWGFGTASAVNVAELTSKDPTFTPYTPSGDESKKYDNFYWGSYNTFSNREGYLVVSKDTELVYYKIDVSNVTTLGNDFVNLKTTSPTVTATGGITSAFTAVSPHEGKITLTGTLLPNADGKHIVSVDIAKPSVNGVTLSCDYAVGSPERGNGSALKDTTKYKDFNATTFSFDIGTASNDGYIAIRYSGVKNASTDTNAGERQQFVLYTLDFSGIKRLSADATAPTITTDLQEQAQTVNLNEELTLKVEASKPTDATYGDLTYQWYSNTTASTTGGTAISGATSATYTVPTSTKGTFYYYCVVTATRTADSKTATATSKAATVTVNGGGAAEKPALTLSLTVASSDLKAGTVGETYTEDLTKHITVTTNGSYTWYATGLPAGLSASTAGAITGIPTASADKKAVTVTVKATSADTEPTSLDKTATLYITINAKTVVPVDPASGDVTSGDVKSEDVKPTEPVKSDDVNPVVPTTSDDEAVKEIENILSGDATQTLTQEQVDKVLENVAALSSDLKLSAEETQNLAKLALSADKNLDTELVSNIAEALASNITSGDGTINKEAMETLTDGLTEQSGKTALDASDILNENSVVAQAVTKSLVSSVENSVKNGKGELNLETVSMASCSEVLKVMTAIATKAGTETAELTLNLGGADSKITVETVENITVPLKAITLENNTSVKEVKLDGASIDKVSMKSSAVKEVKLDASSKVAEIDAKGADLTSIDLASNDNIVTLNISETKVSELNAAGCAGLKDLSAEATSEGAGELREVNLEGCTSLEKLSLSNNKLLGVKKPSGFTTPTGFTFKARGQRRTSDTKFSAGMNFFEFIFNLWKATLSTEDAADKTYETASADAPLNFSDIVSVKADGNNVSFDADGKLSAGSAAPTTGFSYELDPFGLTKTSTEGSSVKAAAEDDGMEVTISGEGEESNGTSGSGGGCDTGLFGFSVLSALAVFITRRQRR